MKQQIHSILFSCLLILLMLACDSKKELPVASGTTIKKVADGFAFTEGPTADAKGNIYFTDQPNNKILKYAINGQLTTFSDSAGRSNGLYIDKAQNLWACADGQNQLWKFDLSGDHEVILNPSGAAKFNGPNDVWVHENGQLYFTDPLYQRPYWENKHDTLPQALYSLHEGQAVLLDADFVQPNGIVGSSQDNILFVADIGANKTYRYRIAADGSLTDKTLFVEQGSDGMTLDDHGNLYLTGKGVDIYDSEGNHLQHLDIPENWTANICFGGRNFDLLYITASTGLYEVKTKVKGIR